MQKRSLLVQVLLDMATGGATLEELIVDRAGTFNAGVNKGYNPVVVPSGRVSVYGEKGVVTNHSVVITPKAQVSKGWISEEESAGSGVSITAGELVDGTYDVSQAGTADITNYKNVTVKSGGTTASINKTPIDAHTVRLTPKATVAQGWQDTYTVDGESVDVNAGELVSGTYPVTESGEFDVSAYEKISVPSGVVAASATKGIVAGHTVTVTPKASRTAGFINTGETEGLGVNVTASELVSGTLNVSQSGTQDVTNYENISVPSGGHSASATKGTVSNHSVVVTPRSTATKGFVQAGTVDGSGIIVSASELVSGTFNVTDNGTFDVSNYKYIVVGGLMRKTLLGSISGSYSGRIQNNGVSVGSTNIPINNIKQYKCFIIDISFSCSEYKNNVGVCIIGRNSYASNVRPASIGSMFPGCVLLNSGTEVTSGSVHSIILITPTYYNEDGLPSIYDSSDYPFLNSTSQLVAAAGVNGTGYITNVSANVDIYGVEL